MGRKAYRDSDLHISSILDADEDLGRGLVVCDDAGTGRGEALASGNDDKVSNAVSKRSYT